MHRSQKWPQNAVFVSFYKLSSSNISRHLVKALGVSHMLITFSEIFANIDKSNVAVERFFFKLSMDSLVGNECPTSIFSGFGGHGLSFFDFGE